MSIPEFFGQPDTSTTGVRTGTGLRDLPTEAWGRTVSKVRVKRNFHPQHPDLEAEGTAFADDGGKIWVLGVGERAVLLTDLIADPDTQWVRLA